VARFGEPDRGMWGKGTMAEGRTVMLGAGGGSSLVAWGGSARGGEERDSTEFHAVERISKQKLNNRS